MKLYRKIWTKEFKIEIEQKVFPPALLQQTETGIVKSWKQRGFINPHDDKLSISELLCDGKLAVELSQQQNLLNLFNQYITIFFL
jgi:hypothetical protein